MLRKIIQKLCKDRIASVKYHHTWCNPYRLNTDTSSTKLFTHINKNPITITSRLYYLISDSTKIINSNTQWLHGFSTQSEASGFARIAAGLSDVEISVCDATNKVHLMLLVWRQDTMIRFLCVSQYSSTFPDKRTTFGTHVSEPNYCPHSLWMWANGG